MAKPASEKLSRGTVINNRYEVLRFVGEGGQKRVYQVKDLNLEITKEIVLKEMKKGDSQEMYLASMQLFEQECILLMKLSHHVLPKIFDFFIDQGTFYIVQEFIEGEELDVLLQKGYLSEEMALEYTRRLAEFLNFLHTKRPPIIFRDLKPSNVIVGKNGNLYIVDMSGALLPGIGSHAEKVKIKTAGYYPPDAPNDIPSPDKDIYALGVVLYETLTRYNVGKCVGKPPPIGELRDNISPEVESVLNKTVFFNRQFRIHTAWEIVIELDEAIRSLNRYKKITSGAKGASASLYAFFHKFYFKYIKTFGPLLLLVLIAGIPAIPLILHAVFEEKSKAITYPSHLTYYFCIATFVIYFIWVRAFEQVNSLTKIYKSFHKRSLGGYRPITILVMLSFAILCAMYALMIVEIMKQFL